MFSNRLCQNVKIFRVIKCFNLIMIMSCRTSYSLIVRKCYQAMDVLELTKYVLLKYFDTIRVHHVLKYECINVIFMYPKPLMFNYTTNVSKIRNRSQKAISVAPFMLWCLIHLTLYTNTLFVKCNCKITDADGEIRSIIYHKKFWINLFLYM